MISRQPNQPLVRRCATPCCVKEAIYGERFCSQCRQAILRNLNESGYLTPVSRASSGAGRTLEMREDIRETKYGELAISSDECD